MRLICSACGATQSLEILLTDPQIREAVAAALALPAPLGDRVIRYLALFRPAQRALSWDRVARLLNELLEPIKAGQVHRDGRAWAAPLALWEQALDEMLARRDKLDLPLKGHGYLFEIVAGKSSKAEGRVEAAREEERRHGHHGKRSAAGPIAVGDVLQGTEEKKRSTPPGWREEALGKIRGGNTDG